MLYSKRIHFVVKIKLDNKIDNNDGDVASESRVNLSTIKVYYR